MPDSYDHWSTHFIVNKYKEPTSAGRFVSEIYFLEKIMRHGVRILDVGCATGGLYFWLQERYKDFSYVGIDVSEPLIKRARELWPNTNFFLSDIFTIKGIDPRASSGLNLSSKTRSNSQQATRYLPFVVSSLGRSKSKLPLRSSLATIKNPALAKPFDVVVATGLFQHEPRYKEMLQEMLKHVKDGGHVLFDVKLVHIHESVCDLNKSYGDHGDHRVYYILLNFEDFKRWVFSSKDSIDSLEVYGYYADVNFSARLPTTLKERVVSAHVLIQKKASEHSGDPKTVFSLPEEFVTDGYFGKENL